MRKDGTDTPGQKKRDFFINYFVGWVSDKRGFFHV